MIIIDKISKDNIYTPERIEKIIKAEKAKKRGSILKEYLLIWGTGFVFWIIFLILLIWSYR